MIRIPRWLIVLCLIMGTLILSGQSLAQEGASTQRIRLQLDDFGHELESLRSPFGDHWYGLGLPATWDLQPGSTLTLDLESFVGINGLEMDDATLLAGVIEVWFNDTLVETVALDWRGGRQIDIVLTPESLMTARPDGRHSLYLAFRSEYDCDTLNETTVFVNADTSLDLAYNQQPLALDLTRFPFPLYQQLYTLEQGVIVVPNEPTAGELSAAMVTASAVGSLTDNKLALSLVTVDEFDAALYESHHLIAIGRRDAFTNFGLESLPPVAETAIRSQGILYMTTSPVNDARVLLYVGGADDTHLFNAAQALSSGALRTTDTPSVSIIDRINDLASQANDAIEFSLSNNNEPMIATTVGENRIDRYFTIPRDAQPSGSGELILRFQHSALLDYDRAGVTVLLNDIPVGSARLDDTTARNGEVNIRLTRSAFVTGENELSIRPNLIPRGCANWGDTSLWFSIDTTSQITIPLESLSVDQTLAPRLSNFPDILTQQPNLRDVAVILPRENPSAWDAAVQLASILGDNVNLSLFGLRAYFDDDVPQDVLESTHLVLVGQAMELDLIDELSAALPAPFPADDNRPDERNLSVVFEDDSIDDVGYIQLARSPYNPLKAILLVNGTSDSAVIRSMTTLIDPPDDTELDGDLAIVDTNQLVTANVTDAATQPGANAIFLVETEREDAITAPAPFEEAPTEYTQPEWIELALQVTLIAIALVLLGGLIFERRSNKQKTIL